MAKPMVMVCLTCRRGKLLEFDKAADEFATAVKNRKFQCMIDASHELQAREKPVCKHEGSATDAELEITVARILSEYYMKNGLTQVETITGILCACGNEAVTVCLCGRPWCGSCKVL